MINVKLINNTKDINNETNEKKSISSHVNDHVTDITRLNSIHVA